MKLYVVDSSLCQDGIKALSFREKLQLASLLDRSGVDALLLPALSGGKEDAVVCRTIAQSVSCAAMVACDSEDAATAAWACVQSAKTPVLAVTLPISTVQMEYHYHKKAPQMLQRIAAVCQAASSLCPNVLFIARDASRAEDGFAAQACAVACENGAQAVMLCDDSGVYFPQELAELVRQAAPCGKPIYVQPSNALELAAACGVEAIRAGACGIGTATEGDLLRPHRLAQLLRTKGDALGVESGLDVTAISATLGGTAQAPQAPAQAAAISLDEASSLSDIAGAAAALGYELTDEDVGKVYQELRRVIRKKKTIGKPELEAIIATAAMQVPSTFHVVNYVVNCGNVMTATANITLERSGETLAGVSMGDGPIDAAFHAIESIIGHHYELDDFQISAVTKGREAVGNALVRLRSGGKLYSGNGVSTDIIGASIRAYINALNKIVYEEK